jgi:copper chaperone CopZ
MKTSVLIALFCTGFLQSFAQIETVRIGVNGLTCSQCTRSVEKKLRQLPFIQDVKMDLANTSGEIHLKSGIAFRPELIPRAIRDAGFSVRFVQLLLRNPETYPLSGSCMSVHGLNLQLAGAAPSATSQPWVLQLQGPAFGGKKSTAAKSTCGDKALQVVASLDEVPGS